MSNSRSPLALLLLALVAPTGPLTAQPSRLIPAPREVVSSEAPIRLRSAITVEPTADPDDRAAAKEFAETMRGRGFKVDVTAEERGWHVELLRVGTQAARQLLQRHKLTFDSTMSAEGYLLIADRTGAHILGASDAGVFYGLQTLKQMITGAPAQALLHPMVLRDWPAMRWRGFQDDLSRGPVPTLEFQKQQMRQLAAYKINVYSPYYEQSLAYNSHPLLAPPGGAMSHADVRELVAFASKLHITIIPEQNSFGHLHHLLKYEIYQSLAETPHGHVLAPGQPGSIKLTKELFAEIDSLFPGPFIHLGADETFELGKGQTKARVQKEGIGAVYLQYLKDIEAALRPSGKQMLFWGDVAMNHPDLVKSLPKDLIAVGWDYWSRNNFDRYLKPFRDAGMQTWVAPGVNNWNRIWPNFGMALANIQGFVKEGQAGGATGLLNTSWDDDGDAIFNANWYGILFGAAAGWQQGESSIPNFQSAFGLQFHGDTTGAIDRAHQRLIAAHAKIGESKAGDGSTFLFFLDPWSAEGVYELNRLRPFLPQVRILAESALVDIAAARQQKHLRESDALDAMELGARRLDWLAAKFILADEIAQAFVRASDPTRKDVSWVDLADISGINGKLQDLRDGYVLTRELYDKAWDVENRPYWKQNVLARFDAQIITWVQRTSAMDQARRRFSREKKLPAPSEIGIPDGLVTPRP